MIWLTSDLHLDHWAEWIQRQRHEFHSVEEMNWTLLNNILTTVRPTDTLYMLGDFAFSTNTFSAASAMLEKHCTVIWVKGNHDPKQRHDPLAADFRYDKRHYYVCHYPWLTWRPNTVMLHGHCHGHKIILPDDFRLQWRYDVGVDTVWNGRKYYPVSILQIEERIEL